jgi:hypothetical protein
MNPLEAPYEPVNLSIFAFSHLSQIKDLAGMKNAKTGKIHILYDSFGSSSAKTSGR